MGKETKEMKGPMELVLIPEIISVNSTKQNKAPIVYAGKTIVIEGKNFSQDRKESNEYKNIVNKERIIKN